MLNIMKSIVMFLVTFLEFSGSTSESDDGGGVGYVFSSFTLQRLIHQEQKLLPILIDYETEATTRLRCLKWFMKKLHSSRKEDPSSRNELTFFGMARTVLMSLGFLDAPSPDEDFHFQDVMDNRVKLLELIQRFSFDLPLAMKCLNVGAETKYLVNMDLFHSELEFPNTKDLKDAKNAILRLHLTYNLKVTDMAEGRLGNIRTGSGLNVHNLFELGKHALEGQVFTKAFEYFDTALELQARGWKQSNESLREELLTVMDAAASFHDMILVTGKFLQQINPYYFEHPIRNVNSEDRIPVRVEEFAKTRLPQDVADILLNFDRLCGEVDLRSPTEKKNLHCQYSSPHPFFRIQPMKMEWLHVEPNVIQIYDFLSEREMRRLRSDADPILTRSGVIMPKSVGHVLQRTSSQTWISDTTPLSPFNFISRRISMATGLVVDDSTTEPLQIANYGAGGLYAPHYDALGRGNEADETLTTGTVDDFLNGLGDRLATFMIYLAHVEAGGGTAFPRLRFSAQPIKGSAILWFNVHADGMTLEKSSIHGGCPVLFGSKYIATKWIRSNGQMFMKKCPVDIALKYIQFQ